MDRAVTTRTPTTIDVAVAGGDLRVGVWDAANPDAPTALLLHGITSSHLAWQFVAEQLPDLRLVAPDLRGRGGSHAIEGPAGLAAHAADLAATLDAAGIERTVVVGHSMGGFVAVVFAHLYPERVSRLVLVDGGLPLDVPAGLDVDAMVAGILGPTAARLSMRFASVDAYLDFWRGHPAFHDDWSPELERYLAYDLVADGDGGFRPATSYATTVEDNVDMVSGTALRDALAGLRHPVRMITVPRGLQNEPPGLYAPEYLARILPGYPSVRHERVDGFNHYTIVLSEAGGDVVTRLVVEELAGVS